MRNLHLYTHTDNMSSRLWWLFERRDDHFFQTRKSDVAESDSEQQTKFLIVECLHRMSFTTNMDEIWNEKRKLSTD